MKALQNFAEANNLQIIPIKYRHQFGYVRRKGYDLVKNDGSKQILASFEPCEYSNGDKWYIRNTHEQYKGPRYFKRITPAVLININPAALSFFINSSAK